jgi:ribosomal protein L37AE/L43A
MDHKPEPDLSRRYGKVWACKHCDRALMFVRASYRPTGERAAHFQHVGDGLVQYRSWRP